MSYFASSIPELTIKYDCAEKKLARRGQVLKQPYPSVWLLFPQEPDLLELMDSASVTPHVNQCEFHPYQNPIKLRKLCSELGIAFEVTQLISHRL